jgi:hypothetical protein
MTATAAEVPLKPQPQTKPQPQPAAVKSVSPVVPIKVGFFGGQGAGKTTSAAMLALALSKELHNGAPVWVTDTEPGWQFLRPMFAAEGVKLEQRTVPTFKATLADIREAERAGACVYAVDSLTIIWNELMQSFKAKNGGRIPINVWGDIKAMWGEYTTRFLNSPMHSFALGRLGNIMEEIEGDKPGDSKLVKTGTAFKAGGSESFGYEPHLLLELSLERKAKRKAGVEHEGEGRMIHRADVLKDRTWALNGKVIRWSDKANYQGGGYAQVWNSLKPHFDRVQQTMAIVTLKMGTSSADLISDDGKSEFYERRERRDLCAEEIKATLDLLWGGSSAVEKRMRLLVTERIFGIKSKEAVAALSLDKLERGLKILQAFEKRVRADKSILDKGELEVLRQLDSDIRQYDEGNAGEAELPF